MGPVDGVLPDWTSCESIRRGWAIISRPTPGLKGTLRLIKNIAFNTSSDKGIPKEYENAAAAAEKIDGIDGSGSNNMSIRHNRLLSCDFHFFLGVSSFVGEEGDIAMPSNEYFIVLFAFLVVFDLSH